MLLRNCRFVVTDVSAGKVLENVDVAIEDGVIVGIGKGVGGSEPELDCSGCVVIPGLVNAHTHAAMVGFRGFVDDFPLFEWLRRVWELERFLDLEVLRAFTEAAVYEMVSCGTTMFADMYLSPETTAEVAREFGVRVATGPTFRDTVRDPEKVCSHVEAFFKAYREDALVKPVVNVHSLYTCSLETVSMAKEVAERLGIRLVIHVSETLEEVLEVKRRYGKFPVELLVSEGVVDEYTVLVHLSWVLKREAAAVAKLGAHVVNCPSSNMKLATGSTAPVPELLALGANVALGTDGAASNNSLDMLREAKEAVLLSRHMYQTARISAREALYMATEAGYRALGVDGGRIAPEKPADIAVIDLNTPRLQPTTKHNVINTLVFSATGSDVRYTVVAGKLVYDREDKKRRGEVLKRFWEAFEKFSRKALTHV